MTYTLTQKREALRKLRENDGNISKTAREINVSATALRQWRDTERQAVLAELEGHMSDHALNLAKGLLDDEQKAPLNQRASALGMLFDRLLKLDDRREGDNPHSRIEIVYRDPDGTTHDTPHYHREGTDHDRDR
ncbi:MAG: transposase [Chloroflexota bacterium]